MKPVYEFFDGEGAAYSTDKNSNLGTFVRKAFCVIEAPLTNAELKTLVPFQVWTKQINGKTNYWMVGNPQELYDSSTPTPGVRDKRGFGYTFEGFFGRISATAMAARSVKLYRSYSDYRGRHFFTIVPSEVTIGPSSLAKKDPMPYKLQKEEGFVISPSEC